MTAIWCVCWKGYCISTLLKGSAIILSATLPYSLRGKLLNAFARGAGWSAPAPTPNAGYPWVSQLNDRGLAERQVATRAEVKRCVNVSWITHLEDALAMIERAVAEGRCICWIRNTVDDAMLVYRQLQQRGKIPEALLLFHSRFAFVDRLRVEQTTLDWFGKMPLHNSDRAKCSLPPRSLNRVWI